MLTLVDLVFWWMHWATRWRHPVLSAASSLASLIPTYCPCPMMLIQFFCLPGFSVTTEAIRESSVLKTCPSHHNLLSLDMYILISYRHFFFRMSSSLTVSFRAIPIPNSWLATLQAISDPYCQTNTSVTVSVRSTTCTIDNVRATLQNLQRREPRRLPACLL